MLNSGLIQIRVAVDKTSDVLQIRGAVSDCLHDNKIFGKRKANENTCNGLYLTTLNQFRFKR